jgi:hypothetical protein
LRTPRRDVGARDGGLDITVAIAGKLTHPTG